jgi:large subunit ribosomal protein L9
MKVIFLEDVPNVAKAGDVKVVADGYGRNYLIPHKLALISKPGAVASVKAQIEARAETEQMKKLAAEIEGKELVFPVKMGAKDRMHGSITSANVATQLQEMIGQTIDKRKIDLEEPIKTLGSYDITLKLLKGIEPKIKVIVVKKEEETAKEVPPPAAAAPEGPATVAESNPAPETKAE